MGDLVKMKGGEYFWVRYIKQRISQNKNFLCILTGQTGSGKSWSALSIAEMVDPSFNVERVIFKGTELLSLINSGNLKKGAVIIWDEAGVDLSNRSWQSATNKLLNFLLQTFRHKNFILIFTTPYSDFIDKLTRRLFHAEMRTISIDFDNNLCRIKPQLIQYNSRLGKFYHKYLRVATGEGVMPVNEWKIPSPSKEMIKAYEQRKKEYTDNLNKSIEGELISLEQGKDKINRPLTEKQKQIYELMKIHNKETEVAKLLGVDRSLIYRQMEFIKRKGYEI